MKHNKGRFAVIFLILSLFFFVLSFFSFRIPWVWGSHMTQNIRTWWYDHANILFSGQNIAKENRILTSRIKILESENRLLKSVVKDIEAAEKQIGIDITKDLPLVSAQVLQTDTPFLQGEIIIDIGSQDGIQVHDLVVLEGNFIGEVARLAPYSSTVRLLSHSESVFSVLLPDGKRATLRGTYSDAILDIDNIPRESSIAIGDQVTLAPSLEYPHRRPLVIGKILSLEKKQEAPFYNAKVATSIDMQSLLQVFVIRSQDIEQKP